jgi:hypothetical protein
MTSKRKKACRHHRTRQQQRVVDVSDDNSGSRSDGEGGTDRVFSTEEFGDPINLNDIEEGLRQRLIVAAPMLMGRDAVYGSDFFTDVVGLCDQGPVLRDVSKVYSFITDEEVTSVWKEGVSKGRYDFSRCQDEDQLKMFGQQYFKVYGNRPHNNYFCLRFLKACFATFIHQKPVNWCAEALDRHQSRIKSASRNPSKLGPVATRCQVEGLLKIIKELSTTDKVQSGPDPNARELLVAIEVEKEKADIVKTIEERVQILRLKYNDSLERMRAESFEIAEEDLNEKYVTKQKEARQILRSVGPTVQYKAAVAESENLFKQLANMREGDALIRENVVQLELDLANETNVLENAKADLESSAIVVSTARGQMLTLKTPRVFQYPKPPSVPPLGYAGKESCAYCGLGFVWKAAVLSSCGCFLHPPCVAEIISTQIYQCKVCKDILLASSPIHLTEAWVAQFGGVLNPHQQIECASFSAVLEVASKCTNAPKSLGSKS